MKKGARIQAPFNSIFFWYCFDNSLSLDKHYPCYDKFRKNKKLSFRLFHITNFLSKSNTLKKKELDIQALLGLSSSRRQIPKKMIKQVRIKSMKKKLINTASWILRNWLEKSIVQFEKECGDTTLLRWKKVSRLPQQSIIVLLFRIYEYMLRCILYINNSLFQYKLMKTINRQTKKVSLPESNKTFY